MSPLVLISEKGVTWESAMQRVGSRGHLTGKSSLGDDAGTCSTGVEGGRGVLAALPTFVDGFPHLHLRGERAHNTSADNLAITGWDLNP